MTDITHNPEKFMRRALELASLGYGLTESNPLVGCVIIHQNQVVAEGYHHKFGGAHAEVEAVKRLPSSISPAECTVFVTLEPCSHFGKTPPCADLLIKTGFKRVFVASLDPNPIVSGNGISKLKSAGIEVIIGLLDDEQRRLNRVFYVNQLKKRPYITLKWAESEEGWLAGEGGRPEKISNTSSNLFTHSLRSSRKGILVGSGTWFSDKPKLDVRNLTGNSPTRIIIDRRGRISESEISSQDILVNNIFSLEILLESLFSKGIYSILVEGGSAIHQSFIESDLWDECYRIKGKSLPTGSVSAPKLNAQPYKTFLIGNNTIEHTINL